MYRVTYKGVVLYVADTYASATLALRRFRAASGTSLNYAILRK